MSAKENASVDLRIYRDRLAGVLGNFLEHYDNALFGLLSPFIAPLFFEGKDPITALILTYSLLPLGIVTKPVGSLLFGWIGDRWGRREALFLSLTGMAIVTITMGCLPLYKDIGPWSSFLLAFCRMLQGFFAAGEVSGGAIFVLEHTPPSKRDLMSSFYDAGSIGGVLLASGLVTLMSWQGGIEEGWRYLFWVGGATAILGIILRLQSSEIPRLTKVFQVEKTVFSLVKENIRPFLGIICVAGFSYTTYSLAFTLMNGLVPLVSSISKSQVVKWNTVLLVYDMFLLPVMGYLAHRLGKEKVMISGAICSSLGAVPMFYLLDHASLSTVIFVRVLIVSFGVAFAAPYYAWAIERVSSQHRYLIVSLAGALGSQLIGAPSSVVCLWLYQIFGLSWAPGLYLLVTGSIAGLTVFLSGEKKRPVLQSNR